MLGHKRRFARTIAGALLNILVFLSVAGSADAGKLPPFTTFEVDIERIRSAIAKAHELPRPEARITGITVPHHLLAADLIARGFWSATGGGDKDRIIVLCPDHFSRAKRPLASTERNFETPLGQVPNDVVATRGLLANEDLFDASELFEKEHGLQALLPYIANLFPGVSIIPIAISYRSGRQEWDRAVSLLRPLVTDRSLIVQSTDFSHYLPLKLAIQRDQEVLNVLAAGDIEALVNMHQPDHMDSIGAQYIQMQLQKTVFGGAPLVIANANSQHYVHAKTDWTTSYILQVFCTAQQANQTPCQSDPGRTFYFGGDTLLGRNFFHLLADETLRRVLIASIKEATAGAPMILNLEGVVVDEIPQSRHAKAMVMSRALTIDLLKRMNVIAVSLANNHSMDFGHDAYRDMVDALEGAGIKTFSHGDLKDLGSFRLWTLTDLSSNTAPFMDRILSTDLEPDRVKGVPSPLIALLHWGKEGVIEPTPRELMLADTLRQRLVTAIVGSHSHRASGSIISLVGGESQMVLSLGNFLFDQTAPEATGALLEVTIFDQGTIFTRLRPIPNYYDLARNLASALQ